MVNNLFSIENMLNFELDHPSLRGEISHVLSRDPIVLSEGVVDRHFRNGAEIEDVQVTIKNEQQERPVLAFGLAGSRLEGRFAYTEEQLARKLLFEYGLRDSPDPEDFSAQKMYRARIRDGHQANVVVLARFLNDQQRQVLNLADIRLGLLPPDVRALLRSIDKLNMPSVFLERTHKNGMPIDELPHPAALFPDIDLIVITDRKPRDEIRSVMVRAMMGDQRSTVGKLSGVRVQITYISPVDSLIGTREPDPIRRSMLEKYRGIIIH